MIVASLTNKGEYYGIHPELDKALELLTPEGEPVSFTPAQLFNAEGEEIQDTRHPMMEIHMRLPRWAPRLSIVRKCR